MKLMSEENQQWYIQYTVILTAIILTVFAMIQAASLLKILLFSLFLSILILPFCNWMEKHGVPRILAAFIAIFCSILLFGGIGTFFYIQLSDLAVDVGSLKEPFEELISGVQQFLSTRFGFEGYIDFETLQESVYRYLGNNTEAVSQWFASAVSIFTSFVLVPVCMFLILIFRQFLYESTVSLFDKKGKEQQDTLITVIKKVKQVVQNYIAGLSIVCMILATVYSIMLYIIGIDYPVLFGLFAGFLAIVPIIGPIIGSIVPIFYALLTMDSLIYPFIILAGFIIVQALEGNFLEPVVLGRQVSLNALAALLFLYVGAEIWGLAGMILFIPIGAIMKATFDEVESLSQLGYMMGRVPREKFSSGNSFERIAQFFKREG
ncbi:MAG: AI-2E family transporter [Balneolaceae bacterium]